MDSPPKLYDLAFKVAIDCYTTGLLQTKVIPHDSIVSEQVFETVMGIRNHCYDDHTKALIREFKPSKLELDLENCQQASFSIVRKLNLTELKIRNFCQLENFKVTVAGKKPPRGKLIGSREYTAQAPSYFKHFAIAQFLGDILSRETKQGLQVLDISGHEPFRENWMEVVPSMFPKLKVLNINNRKLCEENFAHLCNNFPNLHTLHIGNHKLKSLEGISKLTSLENLVIGVSCFRKETDVAEIFKLRNLKSLTISENLHPGWNYEFFFLKPLPELTHLDIQWKGADDEFLERILASLPKLKSVVANRTKIEGYTAPPSVTLYITTNLNTTMKSLAYFRSIGNHKEVLKALSKFIKIYEDYDKDEDEDDEENRPVCTPEQLTVCMNEVELLLEKFKFDEKVVEKVSRCVDIFAWQGSPFQNPLQNSIYSFAANGEHLSDNKLKILNILLKNLANDLKNDNIPAFSILGFIWKLIRNLTRNTENLNIDKIASLAMESIVYGGECLDDWQYSCAVVLAEFIDRTDFSSGYYKESSFRKLYKCLTKLHKNDYWCQESRTSVVKVMKYIEIFM